MASSYVIQMDAKTYPITKTYHHILDGDAATLGIIEEFGLGDRLRKEKVKQGFIYHNSVFGFSSPLEILAFPISLIDKFKLAKFALIDCHQKDWSKIAHLNAKEWIEQTAGLTNYEVFFSQLLKNKFHTSAENISAPWLGTRFVKESSSFLKKFMWLEGGIQQIIEKYAERIERNGGKIHRGATVLDIIHEGDKKTVVTSTGKQSFDVLVVTIPPSGFLPLIKNLPDEFRKNAEKISYLSCICATIGVKGIYTDRYWINVLDKDKHFSVVFQHSALYKDSVPEGVSVFYIATYLMKNEAFWNQTEQEILQIYLDEIDMIMPEFKENVLWTRVAKFENAEAIYSPGFENLPDRIDGIYFAGIYKIYPKIRNMASAIEEGQKVAHLIGGE
jgi:protoporphyrinogen oxidase